MAIPDNYNFSLYDVSYELRTESRELGEFFAEARDEEFDPIYKGNKDRLRNFRNYGGTPASITAPSKQTYYDASHGVRDLTVTVTGGSEDYEILTSPSWITLTKVNSTTIRIDPDPIPAGMGSRGATITLGHKDAPYDVNDSFIVNQTEAPDTSEPEPLTVSPISKTFDYNGGGYTLSINTNEQWTITTNDGHNILTIGTLSGSGDAEIHVDVAYNDTNMIKLAYITVTTATYSVEADVTLEGNGDLLDPIK